MKINRLFLAVALLAIVIAVGVALRSKQIVSPQSRVVTIIIDGTPQTLDPILMTEVMSATLGNACHAPLVRLAEDGSIVPELAESVVIEPDGTAATIILRSDCKFWDQTPVSAADCAWSLLRLRDSQSPLRLTMERIVSCEATDSRTVKVKFSAPEPEFVQMLAHLQAAILKKDSDKLPQLPLARHIIGAGAFAPEEFQPGTQYGFRRNSGFPTSSNIEKVVFLVKTDPQSQLAACRSGDAQIIRLKGPALREALDFGGRINRRFAAVFLDSAC